MKISETHGQLLGQVQKKTQKPGDQENQFQKVMDQVLLEKGKTEKGHPKGHLDPITEGIQLVERPGNMEKSTVQGPRTQLINEIRQALDVVDYYAAKLADSSLPISDMSPLVTHMEDRLDNLRAMEVDPGTPDKLRTIISDLVITIGTEIAKFRRGDYA